MNECVRGRAWVARVSSAHVVGARADKDADAPRATSTGHHFHDLHHTMDVAQRVAGVDAVSARAFLDAAARGDVDAVDAWLASDPCGDVNVVRGEGWAALHYAASRGHVRVAQRLVMQPGVDLNATTVYVRRSAAYLCLHAWRLTALCGSLLLLALGHQRSQWRSSARTTHSRSSSWCMARRGSRSVRILALLHRCLWLE